MKEWNGFKGESWKNNIDVNKFIEENYNEYTGDDSFLETITEKSKREVDKSKILSWRCPCSTLNN